MTNATPTGGTMSETHATSPAQADVDALRDLLDLMEDFSSNDQRARYLLTCNWMRDRAEAKPATAMSRPTEAVLRSAVLALADDWDDFEHDPITCPKYECSDCTMKNAVYDLRTCVWSITGHFACPTCSGRGVWMDEPCHDCVGRS